MEKELKILLFSIIVISIFLFNFNLTGFDIKDTSNSDNRKGFIIDDFTIKRGESL